MSSSPHVQSPLMGVQRGTPRRSPLWTALAVILGLVFIYTGVLKAWDPIAFTRDIQNFHILPWPVGVRVAFYLPWLEILCGLALLTGYLRGGALAILSSLMVIFIGATIAAKVRGIDLDCGCFGNATKNLPFTWHLVIDFALLAGLLALWSLSPRDQPHR
ncbi:MAG: DoxX family protein [Chthoniobacterales bacterium]|nr:DoxX family protein [Chthoniobacterales bacterium]